MNGYSKKTAQKFAWGLSNHYLINPALNRIIPKAKGKEEFLDVGCGHGDYFLFAQKKGYRYTGIDNAPGMIDVATQKYPESKFILGDITKTLKIQKRFDVILCNMLFAELPSSKALLAGFRSLSKLLKKDGLLVLGNAHPHFDGYMQAGLLGRTGVKTAFRGYFKEDAPYSIRPHDSLITFKDYHHTLGQYCENAFKAKLVPVHIDECEPDPKLKKVDKKYYDFKIRFPGYMIITFKRSK